MVWGKISRQQSNQNRFQKNKKKISEGQIKWTEQQYNCTLKTMQKILGLSEVAMRGLKLKYG